MSIYEIYKVARERGLVLSLSRFSRDFLGRASNYASDRGLDRCSVAVLLNLYRRLGDIGQTDLQALAFQHLLEAEAQP
jgi:hypothetical protein